MKNLFLVVIATMFMSCGRSEIIVVKGQDGQNGFSSLIAMAPATSCESGGSTILSGLDLDRSGVLDGAEVTASTEICNGRNGSDGQDGEDAVIPAFTPVAVIDPCGDAPGVYDEVLLRLSNGQILASFSQNASGLNTRFALIPAGSYMTTDGTSCHFTVHANGSVTW